MTQIRHSNLETDLREASRILGSSIRIALADMSSIRSVPGALDSVGSINGFGSDTIQVPLINLQSDDIPEAASEQADLSATALGDSSITVAVVRHGLRRDMTDLARMTAFGSLDDVSGIAQAYVPVAEASFMNKVAAAVDSFSSQVGSTGVALTVDTVFDAQFALELADVPGPYFCLLHNKGWNDFVESLRAEGGAISYDPASRELLGLRQTGYKGMFNNINFFTSSRVDNDGTDDKNGMWGAGALCYATGSVPPPATGTAFEAVNEMTAVEIQRDASAANHEIIVHSYYGVSVREQARGVEILAAT